jgi:hypothetical protein
MPLRADQLPKKPDLPFILTPLGVRVGEVEVPFVWIADLLRMIVDPDHRKWFRFEKHGSDVMVHTRIEEIGPWLKCLTCGYSTNRHFQHCPYDGAILNTAPELELDDGRGSAGARQSREETKDA